ncbi:MAG: FAD-dependent oxidoreductase [Erysipelotrichaceae bacterium]|nr:FAD-dependent oxidoreductase [Erysipelotrichaceae bacterium]
MTQYNTLFTPMKIGNCEIKNRVVITAMEGTGIVENMFGPKFNAKAHDYYISLAKNNVGLLIPGMLPVYSMMMGKWTHKAPKEFEKAKGLIDEIHTYGSKVFFQIGAGFAGRNYTLVDKLIPVAQNKVLKKVLNPIVHLNEMMVGPSDGTPMVWAPQLSTRALTKEEIQAYIDGYAKTAKLCKDAGVDGVEVHAVHEGYLMDQFTMDYTNKRTDEYGGSFENRYRFATEVVKAIKKECGEDYPVMLRYSVTSKVIDFNVGAVPGEEFKELGRDMEESKKAAKYLTDAGYDALDCDNGTYDSWYWAHPPVYMPLNCNLNEAIEIKKYVDVPVICAGKMQADKAEEVISKGQIDGVGIARQFLCDPEFLTKLQEGRENEIRPCISCHNGCLPTGYYKNSGVLMSTSGGETSGVCALNPVTHHEKQYEIKKVDNPKHIAIIGAGIGGMEVARLSVMRGHTVDLYEKTNRLGGVFVAAAAPSFKEKDKQLLAWYENEMNRLNINIHFNTEVKDLSEIKADEYVIATGSVAKNLPINGLENTTEAVDYLNGKEVGENVCIIGGGLTGCEIAYDLVLKGMKPVVVEMAKDVITAPGICMANSQMLRDLLRFYKVPVYLESTVKEVGKDYVVINTKDGEKKISVDNTIVSVGYNSNPLVQSDEKNHIHVIGDANKVGNLKTVIWGAYELAYKL